MNIERKMEVIDGETLSDMRLPRIEYTIDTLLTPGLAILGGAPKVGKSWLAMLICTKIAEGEPLWGLTTKRGTTLYLCLEDTWMRIQNRLNTLTEAPPGNAFFAVKAEKLDGYLCNQIRSFVSDHPDTVLVVIDTLQMVRGEDCDASYAKDYVDCKKLKELADNLKISLLLVHHLRKQADSDPLNRISGSTGLVGAADAIFVLDKSARNENAAVLIATGRDIEYRELELRLEKETCKWELLADSLTNPTLLLPPEMAGLLKYMQKVQYFDGGNTEFAEKLNTFLSTNLGAKGLKQTMNKWRYVLEEHGVFYSSRKRGGDRWLTIEYKKPPDISG